jgi:Protein of unknown function (DUF2971)
MAGRIRFKTIGETGIERLYRYQPPTDCGERLLRLLRDKELRFSDPSSFNDPWDCRPWFAMPTDAEKRKAIVAWLEEGDRMYFPDRPEEERAARHNKLLLDDEIFRSWMKEASETVMEAVRQQWRVCCFAKRFDNQLMWAHYAAQHTGYCIEVDATLPEFRSTLKVMYRTTYPEFSIAALGPHQIATKSKHWKYEEEYRLLTVEQEYGPGEFLRTVNGWRKMPDQMVTSIIVGERASRDTREAIERVVAAHAPHVVIREAQTAWDRYELVITPPIPID